MVHKKYIGVIKLFKVVNSNHKEFQGIQIDSVPNGIHFGVNLWEKCNYNPSLVGINKIPKKLICLHIKYRLDFFLRGDFFICIQYIFILFFLYSV